LSHPDPILPFKSGILTPEGVKIGSETLPNAIIYMFFGSTLVLRS
jgi:hypothetical protein